MRKKDTLYTVHGSSIMQKDPNAFFGVGLTPPNITQKIDWTDPVQRAAAVGTSAGLVNGFKDIAEVNNPFSATKALTTGTKGLTSGLGNIGLGILGGIGNSLAKNLISDGYDAGGVGNAVADIGNQVGGLVSNIPGVGTLAGTAVQFASGLIGGTINRAFGKKTDQQALNNAKEGINYYNNFSSNASTFNDVQGLQAMADFKNPYKGGWFKSVSGENNALREGFENAKLYAENSLINNINNIAADQINNAQRGLLAFGGSIDNDSMGAIEYGFMSDYLTNKKRQAEQKNKMSNLFMGNPSTLFDLGGVLQTHGSDWSTGATHIDAGGSHEENPNEGVQMGVDPEGVPNLVEEGEVVWNDYVFSNRIELDEEAKKKFHFPKKKDITYADATKKLEKEIAERPNDPVSKAGFNAQMQVLEEQQERQKQKMEAQRAKEAFEALSPEEQTAVMQQVAQQEAMAQEAAMQEAAVAQQQTQQPTPEEVAMMQQQQAVQTEPSSEEMLAQQQAQVAALGGRLVKAGDVTEEDSNVFAIGGRKARKAAKRYNKDWFLAHAKSLGMIDDDATDIEGWKFNPNDPDANLSTFNNKYRDFQKKRALETYRTGQRKSKENELFGSNGLYRYSDDKSKIFKARTNDKDRIGWINADYTGAIDDNGNLKGFLSQEDYNKLSDKDKEAYKRINERAGDKMYDFRGKAIEDIYNGSVDEILGAYNYDDGFKWNDKDAQTLQYPVGMERSNLSYLRYVPALGGAIGLAYDMLNPADYSNAEAVEKSGSIVPMFVRPNYNPTYMKPHVFDVWQQRNRNAANLNSAVRTFENTNNPNKSANILAALYNATNLDGQLGIDADKYNREDAFKVAAHNSGENKTLAQLDMQAQLANQRAYDDAQRLGFQGRLYGARMRDDIDARRAASLSANATNLLQSIGNIGEEAYDEDRLRWLERTGTLRSNVYDKDKYTAKDGGKLKKKKGLTY